MSFGNSAAAMDQRTLHHIGLDNREIMLIESLINSSPDLQNRYLFQSSRINRPDILLVNGDSQDAINTWKTLYNRAPQSRVLFISTHDQDFAPHKVLRRPLTLQSLSDTLKHLDTERRKPAPKAHKCLNILIVDDSNQAREFLKLKLAELAPSDFMMSVDCAEHAAEGIDRCEQKDYDLIFLDVEMPGMNGFEACEKIRALSTARIAMLTSKSMAEDFRKGSSAGCNHYLVKPPHDSDIRVILSLTSMKKY